MLEGPRSPVTRVSIGASGTSTTMAYDGAAPGEADGAGLAEAEPGAAESTGAGVISPVADTVG